MGPIIALRVQASLDRWKADRERRLRIFKALMVTRATVLSPMHVEALNSIDIEFNGGGNDKAVREAWKAYVDHLSPIIGKTTEEDQKRWNERTEVLLIELLYVMSRAVGYDFDKTHIKRAAYTPSRYGNVELEHDYIRRSLVDLFMGNKSLPIEIRAGSGESGEPQSAELLRQLLIKHYEGGSPIRVVIVDDSSDRKRVNP